MIICVCNNTSDKKVHKLMDKEPINSVEELVQKMPICNNCECCYHEIKKLIETRNQNMIPEPQLESIMDGFNGEETKQHSFIKKIIPITEDVSMKNNTCIKKIF